MSLPLHLPLANLADVLCYLRRHPSSRSSQAAAALQASSYAAVQTFLERVTAVQLSQEDVQVQPCAAIPHGDFYQGEPKNEEVYISDQGFWALGGKAYLYMSRAMVNGWRDRCRFEFKILSCSHRTEPSLSTEWYHSCFLPPSRRLPSAVDASQPKFGSKVWTVSTWHLNGFLKIFTRSIVVAAGLTVFLPWLG